MTLFLILLLFKVQEGIRISIDGAFSVLGEAKVNIITPHHFFFKELSPGLPVNPGASMVTHHLTTHFSRGLIWSIASYYLDRETLKEISEQLATVPTDRDAPTTVPSPGEF